MKFHPARIVALTLLGLFVAAVASIVLWRMSLEAQNRARLKVIAARGEPVDSAELNRSYQHVPDAENAAFRWLDGFAEMTPSAGMTSAWSKVTLPLRGASLTGEQLDLARDVVSSNKLALSIFREAAARPQTRYPVDLTPGMNALLPHLSKLKSIARLLQAELVVAVDETNTASATDALKTMLAVGRSLGREPILISQLTAYALDAIAFASAAYLLNRLALDDQQLSALTASFAASEETNSLYIGLLGERAIFTTAAKAPHIYFASAAGRPGSSMQESMQDLMFGLVRLTGFFERDFGFGVDALTTNLTLARLPDPHRSASRTNWTVIEDQARRGRYILSGLLLPALSKSVNRDTEDRAKARIAQAALAVERHHRAHGNVPENLAALVPAYLASVPVDPFDGQPLRYQRRDAGYVVYSVGPDTEDDGGLEKPIKFKDGDPWDVTFIVERPESR